MAKCKDGHIVGVQNNFCGRESINDCLIESFSFFITEAFPVSGQQMAPCDKALEREGH